MRVKLQIVFVARNVPREGEWEEERKGLIVSPGHSNI